MLVWFHVLLIKKNIGIAAKSALKCNEEPESNWYIADNSSSNQVKKSQPLCFFLSVIVLQPSLSFYLPVNMSQCRQNQNKL